jgi:hypothetical protein
MLRVYKRIDHKIFQIQDLIDLLVEEVFYKASKTEKCLSKIKSNFLLNNLYENKKSNWFKTEVEKIYAAFTLLTKEEKDIFIKVYKKNNQIEYLCSHPSEKESLELINSSVLPLLVSFFQQLYDRLLKWKDIIDQYGTKKNYYDDLIEENEFNSCPCCGYGTIQTIYDKGHSAFDHYFPLKHYPFSVVNFNNLFPLCTDCNSSNKSSKDILKKNKKVFHPFNTEHPQILFEIKIDPKSLVKFLTKVKGKDRISKHDLKIIILTDDTYLEETESWNDIYGINQRLFGQTATNAVSWIDDVRKQFRKKEKNLTECFDEIISNDSNKHLGFLKSPYLYELKNFNSFIEAFEEVSGNSVIVNQVL